MLLLVGVILVAISVVAGLWFGVDRGKPESASEAAIPAVAGRDCAKLRKTIGGKDLGRGAGGVNETVVSDSNGQPLQFSSKSVEPAAMLAVLASGKQTAAERVRQLQGMRGITLSKEEREAAMAFLGGKEIPESMDKGSLHWLADELLTALRLQEPQWDGLAAALGEVAFQPGTDPVVRDYIMQHLGHLWEQAGARQEIEQNLWKALETTDETTPGSALIALSRGYERDQQGQNLDRVRTSALGMARDPSTPLATRVTALAIAGAGGGTQARKLAESLATTPTTPVILLRVAESILKRKPQ